MIDYKYDKLLSIKTTGDCEGPSAHVHYHRYEPTPYAALEQLFPAIGCPKVTVSLIWDAARGGLLFRPPSFSSLGNRCGNEPFIV